MRAGGFATLRIGEETFTTKDRDKLTTRAKHRVMIDALNETKYRYEYVNDMLMRQNTGQLLICYY